MQLEPRTALVGVAPQRRVINRTDRNSVPHRQLVVVAPTLSCTSAQDFVLLCQEAAKSESAITTRTGGDGAVAVGAIHVYVWKDTTLRELFEAVVRHLSAAAANKVDVQPWSLLQAALLQMHQPPECGGDELPVVKKQRNEEPSTVRAVSRKMVQDVSFYHAFPAADRRTKVEFIATIRTQGPMIPSADLITIAEMMDPQHRDYRLGDVLVITGRAKEDVKS